MPPKKDTQVGGRHKKAAKKKKLVDTKVAVDVDSIPTPGAAWHRSRLNDGDLEVMEASSLILPRVISEWQSALGQGIPFETRPDEVLVFTPFLNAGWVSLCTLSLLGCFVSMVSTQSTSIQTLAQLSPTSSISARPLPASHLTLISSDIFNVSAINHIHPTLLSSVVLDSRIIKARLASSSKPPTISPKKIGSKIGSS